MSLHVATRRCSAQSSTCLHKWRPFSSQASLLFATPRNQGAVNNLLQSLENPPEERTYEKSQRASSRSMGLVNHLATAGRDKGRTANAMEQADLNRRKEGMERLVTRNWRSGDVYAPHDLSPAEMKKWRINRRPTKDVFDVLNINPLNEWKNFALLAEFMTSMGRIKHPRETGLRPVNQRKIAKAIRRAIGMGFHPSVHVHPELLRRRGPHEFK